MITFDSNCTIPPERVAFVGAPNTRGTLDILWSCASVLLICTWSILHLNVPPQSTLAPGNKAQVFLRAFKRTRTKLAWMLLNILAPEWPLGKAWSDRRSVKLLRRSFEEWSAKDGVPWSDTHTYFANMGGFGIRFSPVRNDTADQPNVAPSEGSEAERSVEGAEAGHNDPGVDHPLQGSVSKLSAVGHVERPSTTVTADNRQEHLQSPETTSGISDREPALELGALDVEKAERGGRARDDLPANIQKELDRLIENCRPSAAVLQRFASSQVGKVNWQLDEENERMVAQTSRSVKRSYFPTTYEQDWFMINTEDWFVNLQLLQGDLWVLDASQLHLARVLGIIDKLPSVAAEDLADRNKGDMFVKVIAMGQIGWFVIQLIVRLATRRPTSQLEIMTFAFALCTAVTYTLLLDKPKDVEYTMVVPASRRPREPRELARIALVGPAIFFSTMRRSVWFPNNAVHVDSGPEDRWNGNADRIAFGAAFALAIFGLTHCVAWNFVFPTDIERVLWQASSIITAAAIPTAIVIRLSIDSVPSLSRHIRALDTIGKRTGQVMDVVVWVTLGSFFLARVFILVEVFRSLAFLPPEAFVTNWPANLPHIS